MGRPAGHGDAALHAEISDIFQPTVTDNNVFDNHIPCIDSVYNQSMMYFQHI